jgi:hypothetical protein
MNYSNRTYPHPVLGINDSIEDTFEVNLNVSADKGFIGINLEYNLSNKDLTKLIETRQAAFCMQLYCKGTLYREVFRSHKPLPQKIEIPSSRLHEQVDADFFICACDEISNYTNSSLSDDYKNYTYLIEKGDILAYGGKGVFYANKSFEELKSVSAFMNIDSGDKKKMPMYNYYEGDKITVYLSQTSYELYQKIKNEKSYTDTLHSAVVLPALAEAIRFIDSDDASDYDEKKWFLLLSKLIESNATDDPMQTAQKILDHPVDRSFTSLYEIIR